MDTDKDMKLLGLGQRFLIHGTTSSMGITIFASVYLAFQSPLGATLIGPRWMPAHIVGCITEEEL